MYKNDKTYFAGTNEVHRFGREARERVMRSLEPNEKGYYSIATDGGRFWTIGTSEGKYGEYAKMNNTCFSVNRYGFAYAKAGTPKADAFVDAVRGMLAVMENLEAERVARLGADE